MEMAAYGITDTGRRKKINQDAIFYEIRPNRCGIFAVADGVGGLERGEVASAMAVAGVRNWWQKQNNPVSQAEAIDQLSRLMFENNQAILSFGQRENIRCATTLTLLYIGQGSYTIAHAGDSRAYLYEDRSFRQLTTDHAAVVEQRNLLTNGVGYQSKFRCDCPCGPVQRGQLFLLCSDGIYKRNDPAALEQMMAAHGNNLQQLCNVLVESAKQKGESDNITAIAVQIS